MRKWQSPYGTAKSTASSPTTAGRRAVNATSGWAHFASSAVWGAAGRNAKSVTTKKSMASRRTAIAPPIGDFGSNLPMTDQPIPLATDAASLLAAVRARTPARLLAGRAGVAYRTPTLLDLRRDHAAARDAVWAELDLDRDLGDLVRRFGLFLAETQAHDKNDYLLRPDRGRRLCEDAADTIRARCPPGCDLQIVVGDGLSATAVAAQVPSLLPLLHDGATRRGWSFGQPFVVRHCRVGVLNDVGE